MIPCFACHVESAGQAENHRRAPGRVDDGSQTWDQVPSALPPVVDAHIHLFPERLFEAIWRWFDEHLWPVEYRLQSPAVVDFLLSRGIEHLVALVYAHKPGIARGLNRYLAQVIAGSQQVTGVGTVHPDDPDPEAVIGEALAAGLRGIKLHCHVQRVAADDPRLDPIYRCCAAQGVPVVIHAGKEPASPGYQIDTRALCSASRLEEVLRAFPRLRVCVPHLGTDELTGYQRLLQRYDNLWLDTTMVMSHYLPHEGSAAILRARPERVMYGTDFPNLPYRWERELQGLCRAGLKEEQQALILGQTAKGFYGLAAGR